MRVFGKNLIKKFGSVVRSSGKRRMNQGLRDARKVSNNARSNRSSFKGKALGWGASAVGSAGVGSYLDDKLEKMRGGRKKQGNQQYNIYINSRNQSHRRY